MNRHADEDRIAGELSAIPGLTRGELIGLWEKAHGRPPPKGLSRRLLEYSAAYQVQVKAFGGLKPMVRRKLRARAASGERTSKSTQAQCRSKVRILQRVWMKVLRRRSQRGRFSWQRLKALVDRYWPKPLIRHPWPGARFAVKYPR